MDNSSSRSSKLSTSDLIGMFNSLSSSSGPEKSPTSSATSNFLLPSSSPRLAARAKNFVDDATPTSSYSLRQSSPDPRSRKVSEFVTSLSPSAAATGSLDPKNRKTSANVLMPTRSALKSTSAYDADAKKSVAGGGPGGTMLTIGAPQKQVTISPAPSVTVLCPADDDDDDDDDTEDDDDNRNAVRRKDDDPKGTTPSMLRRHQPGSSSEDPVASTSPIRARSGRSFSVREDVNRYEGHLSPDFRSSQESPGKALSDTTKILPTGGGESGKYSRLPSDDSIRGEDTSLNPQRSFLNRGGHERQRPNRGRSKTLCGIEGPSGEEVARTVVRSSSSAKEIVLAWVQQRVNTYPNMNVTNFSSCWSDGLAFCALIHFYYPEAFDFAELESRNRRHNFQLAFDVAEKYAGICPLLEADDMCMFDKPDWKCVFTYVQSFYRRFRNSERAIGEKSLPDVPTKAPMTMLMTSSPAEKCIK